MKQNRSSWPLLKAANAPDTPSTDFKIFFFKVTVLRLHDFVFFPPYIPRETSKTRNLEHWYTTRARVRRRHSSVPNQRVVPVRLCYSQISRVPGARMKGGCTAATSKDPFPESASARGGGVVASGVTCPSHNGLPQRRRRLLVCLLASSSSCAHDTTLGSLCGGVESGGGGYPVYNQTNVRRYTACFTHVTTRNDGKFRPARSNNVAAACVST